MLATSALIFAAGGQTALAGTASAATIAVNQSCYVDTVASGGTVGAPMTVVGSGFTPGDMVSITSSDGSVSTEVAADSNGRIIAQTSAPSPFFSRPEAKTQTLTATDYTATGQITATTLVRDTELAVATAPPHAAPKRKVTWYFSGFLPGHLIFGHYLRHGRAVARARFGRAVGLCGLLRTRARFYPGHQRYHHYGLQFDDARHYSPHSTPRIVTALNTSVI
jgi:hypothetical protein